MLEMTVRIEREDEHIRIFSNLPGFYLGGTDIERVLGSIIPLAQHCYWRNSGLCVIPEGELDHQQLLETGAIIIAFLPTERLRPPELLVEGKWWKSPHGLEFFVPSVKDGLDRAIFEQIKKDLTKDESGVQ